MNIKYSWVLPSQAEHFGFLSLWQHSESIEVSLKKVHETRDCKILYLTIVKVGGKDTEETGKLLRENILLTKEQRKRDEMELCPPLKDKW